MKTKTLNFHHLNKKIKPITSDWLIYLLILLFFAGLVTGVILIKNNEAEILNRIVNTYIGFTDLSKTNTSAALFFKLFLVTSFVLLLTYFTGLCAVGIPFVCVIPIIEGILSGIVSGYFYNNYMLKGLGYCTLILYPPAIVFTISVIFACRNSILMSHNMLNLLSMRRSQPQESFKNYTFKFLILILIGGLSSLLFTVLSNLFIRIFSF